MVASSVRFSPLLSSQVTEILSPFLPPLKENSRNGFLATAVPHCADSTVRPWWVATTLRMKCAGTRLPALSLRWPVSISWLIRILTLTTPSRSATRILIGSAMGSPVRSAAAAADGYLDFLLREEELAIRLDQRVDVRTLAHLDPRRHARFRAGRDLEAGGERQRILLDQH